MFNGNNKRKYSTSYIALPNSMDWIDVNRNVSRFQEYLMLITNSLKGEALF